MCVPSSCNRLRTELRTWRYLANEAHPQTNPLPPKVNRRKIMLGDGKSGKREKENDGGVGGGIPPSLSNEGKQIERTETRSGSGVCNNSVVCHMGIMNIYTHLSFSPVFRRSRKPTRCGCSAGGANARTHTQFNTHTQTRVSNYTSGYKGMSGDGAPDRHCRSSPPGIGVLTGMPTHDEPDGVKMVARTSVVVKTCLRRIAHRM